MERPIMTGKNLYAVLGVPRDADPSQIRAAYVSLLKRYHPDRASETEAQQDSAQIQRIIGAYRTLKDPRTRAAYDASLRQVTPSSQAFRPAPARAAVIRDIMRRFRPDSDTIFYALMLVIAAVGLYLLVSRLVQAPHPFVQASAGSSSSLEISDYTRLETIVRDAGMMSAAAATNYSSRCFAAARRSRNPLAADPCVSFDMAYVYWRETAGGPIVSGPYFQPDTTATRARAAFGRLDPMEAAARLRSVRAATLRAIMQTPRAPDELASAFSPVRSDLEAAGAQKKAVEAPTPED